MICLIHGTLSVSRHTCVLGEHQKRRDCFCLNTFCFGCSSFVFLLLERYVEWWLKVNIVTLSFFIMTAARQSQAAMFVWSRRLLVLTWPGRCWMQSSSGFWFCADQMSSSNTKPGNRVLYGSGFEDRSIVMLKQERDKHKLQTQSWKKSLCAVAFRFPHIVTWGELQTRSIQRVSTYFWLYGAFWMSSDSVLQSLICRSVAPVFLFWCVEQKHAAVIRLHSSNPDVWKKICVFGKLWVWCLIGVCHISCDAR